MDSKNGHQIISPSPPHIHPTEKKKAKKNQGRKKKKKKKKQKKTHPNPPQHLLPRIRIKKHILPPSPQTIYPIRRYRRLIRRPLHTRIPNHKLRFPCADVEFPNPSQNRIRDEDNVLVSWKMGHTVETERGGNTPCQGNDWRSANRAITESDEGTHIDGVDIMFGSASSNDVEYIWRELRDAES